MSAADSPDHHSRDRPAAAGQQSPSPVQGGAPSLALSTMTTGQSRAGWGWGRSWGLTHSPAPQPLQMDLLPGANGQGGEGVLLPCTVGRGRPDRVCDGDAGPAPRIPSRGPSLDTFQAGFQVGETPSPHLRLKQQRLTFSDTC